MQRHLKAMW